MSINLVKGGRINLTKENPGLTKVRFGLGWDANTTNTGKDFDLDASAFVLAGGKLPSDDHFVFYNHKDSPDGAVHHSGDDTTGGAVGDDETISVDLSKIADNIDEVSFVVTIYDFENRKQNFGQVSNSYIKLYDDATGAEIAKYSLEDDFSTETAVQFGSLYRKDGHWLFKAVGTGYNKGLADFVRAYGGNVA